MDSLLARDAAEAWASGQWQAVIEKLEDMLGRFRQQRDGPEAKRIVK